MKGKAVVANGGLPGFIDKKPFGEIDTLFQKIEKAQKLGAGALILCLTVDQADKYAPYLAYTSNIPETLRSKITQKKDKGSFTSIDMELTGLISKSQRAEFEIKIPVIAVVTSDADFETVDKLIHISESVDVINSSSKASGKIVNNVNAVFNIEYKVKNVATSNIIGFIEGADSELRNEVVVLGAHYDHLGRNDKGEIFFGADDNASGVAALLEVAALLVKKKDSIKRSVIFAAFGAEEWGLSGSRYFTDNPLFKDKKIVNMVNMDSIGRGDPYKVWFVGSSFYPELASVPAKYLGEYGLVEGDNIDKYAFEYGSDHYPFHLKGVPAIDIFSTNYRELHKITDVWPRVDGEKVAKIANVVYKSMFELLTK